MNHNKFTFIYVSSIIRKVEITLILENLDSIRVFLRPKIEALKLIRSIESKLTDYNSRSGVNSELIEKTFLLIFYTSYGTVKKSF